MNVCSFVPFHYFMIIRIIYIIDPHLLSPVPNSISSTQLDSSNSFNYNTTHPTNSTTTSTPTTSHFPFPTPNRPPAPVNCAGLSPVELPTPTVLVKLGATITTPVLPRLNVVPPTVTALPPRDNVVPGATVTAVAGISEADGSKGRVCVPTTMLEPDVGMKMGVLETVTVAPPGVSVVPPMTKMGLAVFVGLGCAVKVWPPAVMTGVVEGIQGVTRIVDMPAGPETTTAVGPGRIIVVPGSAIVESGRTMVDPELTIVEPGTIIVEPELTMAELGATIVVPRSIMEVPGLTTEVPGSTAVEPGSTIVGEGVSTGVVTGSADVGSTTVTGSEDTGSTGSEVDIGGGSAVETGSAGVVVVPGSAVVSVSGGSVVVCWPGSAGTDVDVGSPKGAVCTAVGGSWRPK
jgi:hypothetical protein